jgi:DNA-binding response OmpR family regulator
MIEAANGHEAMTAILGEPPDLAVLDADMPRLNGRDLCKKMRSIERLQNIPVLLLTSRSTDSEIDKALNAGADAFMAKPFEMAELEVRVNLLLGAKP